MNFLVTWAFIYFLFIMMITGDLSVAARLEAG